MTVVLSYLKKIIQAVKIHSNCSEAKSVWQNWKELSNCLLTHTHLLMSSPNTVIMLPTKHQVLWIYFQKPYFALKCFQLDRFQPSVYGKARRNPLYCNYIHVSTVCFLFSFFLFYGKGMTKVKTVYSPG